MSNVKEVTTETFEKEVLSSDVPVLVDFWAEWCGPCKQLAPRVEEAAQQYGEQIKVCKVDIEEHRDLAVQYGIRSIPSLIIFKSGLLPSITSELTSLKKFKLFKLFIDLFAKISL